MMMLNNRLDFTDVAPQSCGNTEDRRFRVLHHAGRGDPRGDKTTVIVRQSVDSYHTAKETEMFLHIREEAQILSNVHAEELHSGVRGELYANDLQLRAVLHAK